MSLALVTVGPRIWTCAVRSTQSGSPHGLSPPNSATHWGAAKTLLSACRSRLSIFFRRTDSVSSKAADAVVASESASALVSGRFVSLFLYLDLDPPTGCQHLGACAAGLPSFSCVLLSFPRSSGDFRTIPAITGAEVSVLIVAARGESPLRSSCLPAILVCPVGGALFGVTVDRA